MAINRPVDKIVASARRTKWGYKAMIRTVYDNGAEQTHIPVSKTFSSHGEALAAAERHMAAVALRTGPEAARAKNAAKEAAYWAAQDGVK